jgi:alpha-tubulin suppressor-like RCC1 family protein
MTSRSVLRAAQLALAAAILTACADQLPPGAARTPATPRLTVTPTNPFTAIDGGQVFACGLTSGGQGWCWGRNNSGQLGDSTATNSSVAVAVYQPGLTFSKISLGQEHACALTGSGAAYCWGYDADGRLGDGNTNLPLRPVPVLGGISFASVSAGQQHTCGLDGSGQAYCWGYNFYGQIGNNATTYASTPTAVQQPGGVTFASIAAGEKHSCALDTGGQAWCWGYGGDGALGYGVTIGDSVPAAVTQPVGVTFSSIYTEYNHTCALDSGGQAYCWGVNSSAQLGDSTTVKRFTPVAVKQPVGVTFTTLATGSTFTCGLTGAGQAYCWGSNQFGQIGDGTNANRRIPTAVSQPAGVTFTTVRAQLGSACGLDTSNQTWCWGRDDYGQLGDNATNNQNVPVAVVH